MVQKRTEREPEVSKFRENLPLETCVDLLSAYLMSCVYILQIIPRNQKISTESCVMTGLFGSFYEFAFEPFC